MIAHLILFVPANVAGTKNPNAEQKKAPIAGGCFSVTSALLHKRGALAVTETVLLIQPISNILAELMRCPKRIKSGGNSTATLMGSC